MKTHLRDDRNDLAALKRGDSGLPVSSLLAAQAARNNSPWRRRFFRSGFFFGAMLFHMVLFLLVATWVVFRQPDSTESETFQAVKTPPLAPPPTPPPPVGGDTRNLLDPEIHVTPPSAPLRVIVSPITQNNFVIQSKPVPMPNLPAPSSVPQGSGLQGDSVPGADAGAGNPFGTQGANGATEFTGYLYDLKQKSDRSPTGMTPVLYHRKIAEFVNGGWDPHLLDIYYKASTPLATSYIFIPTLSADDGPKAFGVEKEVQPNMYVMWYHVRAMPARDGFYRFVGVADDILIVRVNGSTVLDGSLTGVWDRRNELKTYPIQNFQWTNSGEKQLYVGNSFHASPDRPVDIDVLIGEEPGGHSNYFLLIQRDDGTYEKQSNGAPLLPIFQLTPKPVVPHGSPPNYPPYSTQIEAWSPDTGN